MANLIIILVIAAILGLAGGYIYREKRAGKACVGCPYSGSCAKSRSGGCGHNPGQTQ